MPESVPCSLAPFASNLPWNGMKVETAVNEFASIIGLPETVHLSGSQAAAPWDPTFAIPLPFGFTFFGKPRPAGTMLHAGIGGFLGFDDATTDGALTYDVGFESSGRFSHLLMPYWSDLRGAVDGGIFVHHHAGSDGMGTLTIEWRVEGMYWPAGNPGNFQVKLFQADNAILFLYDTANPIVRARPLQAGDHFGAAIGVKNLGQACPRMSGCTTSGGEDDCGVMLMTNTEGTDLPPVITRLPVIQHGATAVAAGPDEQAITPEWYADYGLGASGSGAPSRFFHYTFPSHGFRIKPVDGNHRTAERITFLAPEMPAMSNAGPVLGRPIVYPHLPATGIEETTLPVMISVRSHTDAEIAALGVRARIMPVGGDMLYSEATMTGTLRGNGGRREVFFAPFTAPAPGAYTVHFTLHENAFDDSAIIDQISWTFDVGAPLDVGASFGAAGIDADAMTDTDSVPAPAATPTEDTTYPR